MKQEEELGVLPRAETPVPVRVLPLFDNVARAKLARLAQGNIPHALVAPIEELDRVARYAALSLRGDPRAGAELERLVETAGAEEPDLDKIIRRLAPRMREAGRTCDLPTKASMQILRAAFHLDFVAREKVPVRTRRARRFLEQRLRTVDEFARRLASGGTLPADPLGFEPPPWPEPFPEPFEDFLGDALAGLCMAYAEQAATGLLNDEYIPLVDRVKPACLCVDQIPGTVFTAYPAQGRKFPANPWPQDVYLRLYFRDMDITSLIVARSEDEIRFRLPLGSSSGFVRLQGSQMETAFPEDDLERMCGGPLDLAGNFRLQQGPGAFIGVVHPPAIHARGEGFLEDGTFESCRTAWVCWDVVPTDVLRGAPHPDCGRVSVRVLDEEGGVLAEREGASGCVPFHDKESRTVTVEARTVVGSHQCGQVSAEVSVPRTALVKLFKQGFTDVVFAGGSATVRVEISCAAPAEGIVVTLQLDEANPVEVTIPEGETHVEYDVQFAADACGLAVLTANADGHREGIASFDVTRAPYLSYPYPDTRGPFAARHPFAVRVLADCVPGAPVTLVWRLTERLESGVGAALDLDATQNPDGSFILSLPTFSVPSLTPGVWMIEAIVPAVGLRSNRLDVDVDCVIDVNLTTVAVDDGNVNLRILASASAPDAQGVTVDSNGTISVLPDPIFRVTFPSPTSTVRIGENDPPLRPDLKLGSYLVPHSELVPVMLRVIVIDEDDHWLVPGIFELDDLGSARDELSLDCRNRTTVTLTPEPPGLVFLTTELVGDFEAWGATVRLIYTAVPR